jgi:photosystem II stability/assembly factor-like uncharacterized protein
MSNKVLKLLILFSLPLLIGAGCSLTPQRTVQDGGIWYSADKAQSWQQKVFVSAGVDQEDKNDDELIDSANINFLKFHLLDSRIIYANTSEGVYFTEDSADTWQLIFTGGAVNDLAADPATRGTVYAAVGNTLLKTTDNGGTWQQVFVDSRGASVSQVVINPLNPDLIYVAVNTVGKRPIGELLQSFDSGATWQKVESLSAQIEEQRFKSFNIRKLLISPRDPQQLYIATQVQGIWASFDAGGTWQNMIENYRQFASSTDYRDLQIDETRDGAMLYASAYGLLWTFDWGFSWSPIELLTPTGSINIRALSLNPNNPDEIYFANESVLHKTDNGGANWVTLNLPSSRIPTSLLVDFFDGNKLYLGVERPVKKKGLIGF